MAVPQLPYVSDPAMTPPDGDPGALLGTLREVPGVIGDAVGAYRDAEQGLARTLNNDYLPLPLFPVPPPGQTSFLPQATPAPPPTNAPTAPAPEQQMDLSFLAGGGGGTRPDNSFLSSVGSDVQRTRQVQTAGEKQALGQIGDAFAERRRIATEQGALEQQKAIQESTQVGSENQRLADQEVEANKQRVRMDEAVTKADGYLKQQRDAYQKDGIRSFYADTPRGTAAAVASALFTGLGAWSQALGGGPNIAWTVLKDAMDRHENRERARLDQQLNVVNMADRDVTRMEQRKAAGLIEIANNRLALLETFKRERLANAAKAGIPEAKLANDALLNNITMEEAKLNQTIQQGLRTTVQTSNATQQAVRLATAKAGAEANGPPKIEQTKANSALIKAVPEVKRLAGMAPYNAQDQKVIDDWRRRLESTQFKATSWDDFIALTGSLKGDTIGRLSAAGKQRFDAETVFAESVLRYDSGASIGPTEYLKKLAPVQIFASDTPEAARVKAERRQTALAAIAAASNKSDEWLKQLGMGGGGGQQQTATKLSSQDAATLGKFVLENRGSNDPNVRAKVQAAEAALSGQR